MSERECRYPCGCEQFPEEHCSCMDGHEPKAGRPNVEALVDAVLDEAKGYRIDRAILTVALSRALPAEDGLPDALHLCSTDCPEPCPHVWYPAFLPAALRVLSYDSGLQREADLEVGWDYGPEQGAWLRALADALEPRPKETCDHAPEHVTSDGLRWPLTCDNCRVGYLEEQ